MRRNTVPRLVQVKLTGYNHFNCLALAQRFSNGLVNIKTHTVTFPQVRFEPGKVIIVVDSRIDAFVSVSFSLLLLNDTCFDFNISGLIRVLWIC